LNRSRASTPYIWSVPHRRQGTFSALADERPHFQILCLSRLGFQFAVSYQDHLLHQKQAAVIPRRSVSCLRLPRVSSWQILKPVLWIRDEIIRRSAPPFLLVSARHRHGLSCPASRPNQRELICRDLTLEVHRGFSSGSAFY
jgi:hypothetical protein